MSNKNLVNSLRKKLLEGQMTFIVTRDSLTLKYLSRTSGIYKVKREIKAPFGKQCYFWEIKKDFLEILYCIEGCCSSRKKQLERLKFRKNIDHNELLGSDLVDQFIKDYQSSLADCFGISKSLPLKEQRKCFQGLPGDTIFKQEYTLSDVFSETLPPFFEAVKVDQRLPQRLEWKANNENLTQKEYNREEHRTVPRVAAE